MDELAPSFALNLYRVTQDALEVTETYVTGFENRADILGKAQNYQNNGPPNKIDVWKLTLSAVYSSGEESVIQDWRYWPHIQKWIQPS